LARDFGFVYESTPAGSTMLQVSLVDAQGHAQVW
jgi:hypothetical protein